jgi:hypothetical protein
MPALADGATMLSLRREINQKKAQAGTLPVSKSQMLS